MSRKVLMIMTVGMNDVNDLDVVMGDDLLTSCIRIVSFLSRHITVYCEHVKGI